ncbi:terminase [Nakamurella sp. A5-74]|uniref:Terminase n=1 Tax=Nakamurella sp. A5-74 TaxID=3158264 RepID=A0AAU8DJH6_9ACTN
MTGTSPPRPPADLARSGKDLWRALTDDYELAAQEMALLTEACRTLDSCDALQVQLTTDGLMSESSQGVRVHPALVELRQQRIALARMFAALRVPTGDDGRLQSRPTRGVYSLRPAQ